MHSKRVLETYLGPGRRGESVGLILGSQPQEEPAILSFSRKALLRQAQTVLINRIDLNEKDKRYLFY